MMYVDESLCAGCGVCVETCAQGAISLQETAASIDEARCTSCGRCIDVCLTGAIISVEIVSERPPTSVPAQRPGAQSLWAGTPPFSPDAVGAAAIPAASSVSRSAPASKLAVVEKVLSGLLSVAAFALERKQGRSAWPTSLKALIGSGTPATGAGSTRCSGPRQVRGDRQGLGAGQGPRDGRGPGAGRGRNVRCQASRRNRST
jgi:Fe-S-cluster-containing hydrogenase component 2